MEKEAIYDILVSLFADKTQNKITLDTKLRDIGLNSITFIEMIIDIEMKFDIEYPDDMLFIDATEKIEDLVQVIYLMVNHEEQTII